MNKYLVIGGVDRGTAVATRLRRLDEKAQITMIDKGDYISFSNCALPYYEGTTSTLYKARSNPFLQVGGG